MRQRGAQIGAPFKDQPYVKNATYLQLYHAPLAHFVRSSHGLFTRYVALLLASTYTLRLFYHFSRRGPIPSSTIASLCLRCRPLRNEGTIAMTIILKNALVPPCYQIAPKMCDFQRSHKYAFQRTSRATFLRLGASSWVSQ